MFINKSTISFVSVMAFWLLSGSACGQTTGKKEEAVKPKISEKKMKVEIWSDVMCPFCYIGKRRFESALAEFPDKNNIEIVWKSFQLNPALKTDPDKNTIQHLAETKGWSMEQTRQTIAYVTQMAEGVGLHYDFDRAVVANSFDAHRFIQYAKTKGKGDAAEEQLFKAYFTEGKNTADHSTLVELGVKIGLEASEVKEVLSGDKFSEQVRQDISEAEMIGVQGVPFFVIDRKYAVSGAQETSVFTNALNKAWADHKKNNLVNLNTPDSEASCTPDGECK